MVTPIRGSTRLYKVHALIGRYTTGRALGFMGEPAVDAVQLNVALDRR